MSYLWGIDLGGTKVECVVLDTENHHKEVARERIRAKHSEGYDNLLDKIAILVNDLIEKTQSRPHHIGIGTPGKMDEETGLMMNCHNTCLLGRPFKADLSEKLGIEVRIANDANCFALAEANIGVVQQHVADAKMVFGVIMGTGVGGGLVIDGKVWNGRNRIAAEFGHTQISDEGNCYCGRVGCLELFLSGPSLEKYYREQSGVTKKLSEIIALAHAKEDEYAMATFERLLDYFAKAMGNIINMLDPDAIVIGGGLANIDALFTEGINRIPNHIFMDRLNTPILRPKLGGSAGVYGAAFL